MRWREPDCFSFRLNKRKTRRKAGFLCLKKEPALRRVFVKVAGFRVQRFALPRDDATARRSQKRGRAKENPPCGGFSWKSLDPGSSLRSVRDDVLAKPRGKRAGQSVT